MRWNKLKTKRQFLLNIGMTENLYQQLVLTPYQYYNTHRIKKTNGDYRTVFEAKNELLAIQKVIRDELTKVYSPPNYVHGFVRNRCTVSNASFHLNKKCLLTLDIKEFFQNIHSKRIILALSQYMEQTIATLLTNLCILNNSLATGTVVAPVISNIVFENVDKELFQYCISNLNSDSKCNELCSFSDVI